MTANPQFREEDHQRGLDGKFAATMKPEAQVEPLKLFDREDGTFLDPPASKTAEHCVRFWSAVKIPDEIVVAFRDSQELDRRQRASDELQTQYDHWLEQWKQGRPQYTKEERSAAWREYSLEHQIDARIAAKYPALAHPDASQAIRAMQMFRFRPDPNRWPDESQAVLDHQIETWHEHGYTVKEMVDVFNLSGMRPVVDRMPQPLQPVNRDDEILQALRAIQTEIQVEGEAANRGLIDLYSQGGTGSYRG